MDRRLLALVERSEDFGVRAQQRLVGLQVHSSLLQPDGWRSIEVGTKRRDTENFRTRGRRNGRIHEKACRHKAHPVGMPSVMPLAPALHWNKKRQRIFCPIA